ncbi:pentatricopeptide repeat-containing protein, mitochondrial [Heracleum sosnowskyi]|uniref:Pentatricopeptide repeat-containing protein, mitochondrial n=1 Tax=Heracleum sosnowskyi TaxID=360622 RepID=A0AAD8HEW7_9APIA|nr:pentatricopeptide repeat-containing protein, mitochondrial [Heracleum sosnowskyi]
MGNMDKAIEVLEMMMLTNENPFNNFVCSSVISGFVKVNKPDLAIGFFENAVKTYALHPNVVTYTALFGAYYRLGRLNELISGVEKDGVEFDVVFYTCWMYECFREGFMREGLVKYKELVERKIVMDTIGYNVLIDGFSKQGVVEKGVGLLRKMEKEGLRPNVVTYTAIIMGFCKKGKLVEGFELFKLVRDLGVEVDEIMYAALIDGFCRRGYLDYSFHLLADMEKRGICIGIVTYNTVINGLCKVGRTREADDVSKRILGDAVTYCTILQGYIREHNVMGMLEMRKRLEAESVRLDLVMCNNLIKALFMVGLYGDALAIYKRMPEMELTADSVTYFNLIEGFCKIGRLDEALEVFDELRKTSIFSVECYSCIIHGLCKMCMTEMATEVFIEFGKSAVSFDVGMLMILLKAIFHVKSAEGILDFTCKIESLKPEIFDISCNHVVPFLYRRGFPEHAYDVYSKLRSKGSLVTNWSHYCILRALNSESRILLSWPTVSTLVKIYGIDRPEVSRILVHLLCLENVSEALKFLRKMKGDITFPVSVLLELIKNGKALDAYNLVMESKNNLPIIDVVDYTIVVDGLCKDGYINKALDICSFVRKKGIKLNIITYNSVINGLCHQGCLVQAFRLFDSLENINMVPSLITYSTLISALSKEGCLHDARKLFERMVIKGSKPNTRVYNSLINGHCRFGQMQEVLNLILNLEDKGLNPDEFTVSAVINCCYHIGDMEKALKLFFEFKSKGVLPDFLGFVFLVRGLCSKGRMEESRSIIREMLQAPSVINLLKEVETKFKTESMEHLLSLLCDQGRIQEANTVINEVGSMFFPLEKFGESISKSFASQCSTLNDGTSLELETYNEVELDKVKHHGYLDKESQQKEFDSYCDLITLFCSRGELQKANNLAKLVLTAVDKALLCNQALILKKSGKLIRCGMRPGGWSRSPSSNSGELVEAVVPYMANLLLMAF